MMIKKREQCLDILKGIAIFLMVLGHSGINEGIIRFIYLFHMAVFVMASGYCYNEDYSKGGKAFLKFIKRRILTLWLPYVVWLGVLIAFHNVLISINLYSIDEKFLEDSLGNSYGLVAPYSHKETMVELIKAVVMCGSEQLFGTGWFLRVLFYTSILWCVLDNFFHKILFKHMAILRWSVSFVFLFVGWMMKKYNIFNVSDIPTIFTAYVLFTMGLYLNKGKNKIKVNKWLIITFTLSLLGLLGIYYYGGLVNMQNFDNPICYLLASLFGWSFLYACSKGLEKSLIAKIWVFIGQNTMPIVLFHFVAFKLVTLIQMVLYDLPIYRLASFPIYISSSGWWLAYLLVGMVIPLMGSWIMGYLKNVIGKLSLLKRGWNNVSK